MHYTAECKVNWEALKKGFGSLGLEIFENDYQKKSSEIVWNYDGGEKVQMNVDSWTVKRNDDY